MNQCKLAVVKQEIARVNIDVLRISELKWTGMGKFSSDDHYIYYYGQEFWPLLCQHVFSSVQSLSCVQLFATPWTAALQDFLSVTNSQSLLQLKSIESVMPSNHLILCHPLLLLPSIIPSIRIFSNESALPIRWPKYWGFSFSISPSIDYSEVISFRIEWCVREM